MHLETRRLAHGASVSEARAEMDVLAEQLRAVEWHFQIAAWHSGAPPFPASPPSHSTVRASQGGTLREGLQEHIYLRCLPEFWPITAHGTLCLQEFLKPPF